jgi:SOS-response transcriptional repressor LexA
MGGPFAKDRFLVRAEGDSMEPKIKDGQLCLFRKDPGGSRNGKIVLCQVGGFAGEAPIALIKQYRSARTSSAENLGKAKVIVLSSINEKHEDIVLTEGEHLSVIGLFERIIED